MMVLLKCLYRRKEVCDLLRLNFNAAYTVLMCKIGVKYKIPIC